MDRINWNRVLLGGLLAGLIINASEFVLNGVVLQSDWNAAMKALNKPGDVTGGQIAGFNLWGFATGIIAVWLYAAIRPRYGAGPKTAAIAGVGGVADGLSVGECGADYSGSVSNAHDGAWAGGGDGGGDRSARSRGRGCIARRAWGLREAPPRGS